MAAHAVRNKQGGTDADFWAQWSKVCPRMALCVKVTPASPYSTILDTICFTSNSRDMTLPGHPGLTFKATPNLVATTLETGLDEPGTVNLSGVFGSAAGFFQEVDVLTGRWNYCDIEIFSISWEDTDLGEVLWHKGLVGEFKSLQTYFEAESRGYMSLLSSISVIETASLCRVKDFRDSQCGHAADNVTIGGTQYNVVQGSLVINTVNNQLQFIVEMSTGGAEHNPPDDFWKNGKMTCNTSGDPNEGIAREVQLSEQDTPIAGQQRITIKRPFPHDVAALDTFNFVAGCSRTLDDCIKFSQSADDPGASGVILNRRAEDWTPGLETVHQINPVTTGG